MNGRHGPSRRCQAVAPDILHHRIIPTYEAEAEEKSSDSLVADVLEVVEIRNRWVYFRASLRNPPDRDHS